MYVLLIYFVVRIVLGLVVYVAFTRCLCRLFYLVRHVVSGLALVLFSLCVWLDCLLCVVSFVVLHDVLLVVGCPCCVDFVCVCFTL